MAHVIFRYNSMRLPNRTLERIKECFEGIPEQIAKGWAATLYGYKTWNHMVAEVEAFKGVPTPDDEDVSLGTWETRWDRQLNLLSELSGLDTFELVGVTNRISATSRDGVPRVSVEDQAQELFPRGLRPSHGGDELPNLLEEFAKMAGVPLGQLPQNSSRHPSTKERFKKEGPTMAATLFFTALERGNHGEALSILQSKPDFKDALSERGMTALTCAVEADARDVVKELLKLGVNPNMRDSEGFTSLVEASRQGNPWAVSQLLAAGADPNSRTDFGWSPMLCAMVGNPFCTDRPTPKPANVNTVVKMLLDAGADPNLSNIVGMTPAAIAAEVPGLEKELIARLTAGQR